MAENSKHELSERKKRILKAIVDAHIVDGEPVGSKYIMQDEHLNCSSATIRNEMAELEALGYLEQPHTSAGRVPSELGYRFYVDSLIESYAMTTGEITEIKNEQYGNLYIKDEEGNTLYVYGLYNADGTVRYDAMTDKPQVIANTDSMGEFRIIHPVYSAGIGSLCLFFLPIPFP